MWRNIIAEIKTKEKYGIILACSGGMDSMFLFHFLLNNKIKFVVAHFDHRMRENSHLDMEFVKSKCEEYGITFHHSFGKDIKNENDAREQRYAFLKSLAWDIDENVIMTGHHFNDQIETAIFRLTRGAALDNLLMKKHIGRIYRPLINVPREKIEQQVKARKIEYVEDETNFTSEFDRGFIRNEIIPLLMKRRNIVGSMLNNCRVEN